MLDIIGGNFSMGILVNPLSHHLKKTPAQQGPIVQSPFNEANGPYKGPIGKPLKMA